MEHRQSKRARVGNCRLQDFYVPAKPKQVPAPHVLKPAVVESHKRDEALESKLKEAIAGLCLSKPSFTAVKPALVATVVKREPVTSQLTSPSRVPFYYGSSARFTSSNKLYVDFDHMFATVVLPHNLASSAYTQWLKSRGPQGPQVFRCFDFAALPTEHTISTPFNVCLHPKCQQKTGRILPCKSCNSSGQCASEKVCKRLKDQRAEAFHSCLVSYTKEEKIATCTEFWDYLFAGEDKLPKEMRSKTQQDMLLRIWRLRPKALFFLEHVFNPSAAAEGVIKIVEGE